MTRLSNMYKKVSTENIKITPAQATALAASVATFPSDQTTSSACSTTSCVFFSASRPARPTQTYFRNFLAGTRASNCDSKSVSRVTVNLGKDFSRTISSISSRVRSLTSGRKKKTQILVINVSVKVRDESCHTSARILTRRASMDQPRCIRTLAPN